MSTSFNHNYSLLCARVNTNEQCHHFPPNCAYLSPVLGFPITFYKFCVKKSFLLWIFYILVSTELIFHYKFTKRHLDLKVPQTAGNKASCSKCGFKHTRPVGNRCKRTLNSSSPTLRDAHSSDEEVVAEPNQQPDTAVCSSTGTGHSTQKNCSLKLQTGRHQIGLNFKESARH